MRTFDLIVVINCWHECEGNQVKVFSAALVFSLTLKLLIKDHSHFFVASKAILIFGIAGNRKKDIVLF